MLRRSEGRDCPFPLGWVVAWVGSGSFTKVAALPQPPVTPREDHEQFPCTPDETIKACRGAPWDQNFMRLGAEADLSFSI